jgi:hypothetical protein
MAAHLRCASADHARGAFRASDIRWQARDTPDHFLAISLS